MHTNSKRQDVYWTQVYTLNLLFNLVVIWRYVSLYILSVIKCSSLQSLAWVTGRPSWNTGEKDGRMALRLKKLSFNQRIRVQASFIVCEHTPRWGVLEQDIENQPERQTERCYWRFFKSHDYIHWQLSISTIQWQLQYSEGLVKGNGFLGCSLHFDIIYQSIFSSRFKPHYC